MSNEPRKLPTRPGWWWADMSEWHGIGDVPPEPLEVYIEGGRIEFDGMDCDSPGEDQVRFLAPIPGPAVLAALAEYIGALYDIDDKPAGSDGRERAFSDWTSVQSALHSAIRAERDGGA